MGATSAPGTCSTAGSLSIRAIPNRCPASSVRTISGRRRCTSIPTSRRRPWSRTWMASAHHREYEVRDPVALDADGGVVEQGVLCGEVAEERAVALAHHDRDE